MPPQRLYMGGSVVPSRGCDRACDSDRFSRPPAFHGSGRSPRRSRGRRIILQQSQGQTPTWSHPSSIASSCAGHNEGYRMVSWTRCSGTKSPAMRNYFILPWHIMQPPNSQTLTVLQPNYSPISSCQASLHYSASPRHGLFLAPTPSMRLFYPVTVIFPTASFAKPADERAT